MDPFATSKLINFVTKKLAIEFDEVTDHHHKYDTEISSLFDRAENHLKSNHVRFFSKEMDGIIKALVDPSYGSTKLKVSTSVPSYPVTVRFFT